MTASGVMSAPAKIASAPQRAKSVRPNQKSPVTRNLLKNFFPDSNPEGSAPGKDMERFRIEVGSKHDVKPGNIVGAIANEAELDSEYIGKVEIFEDYSTVDLPSGMPKELFKHLRGVWVSGQRLEITRLARREKQPPQRKSPRKAKAGKKKS